MKIYYTCNYDKEIRESHKLLEDAIAHYLEKYEVDEQTCGERAAELVSKMYRGTEYGKPVIDDFKDFSISHSGSLWAVAISHSRCGLDVQIVKDSTDYKKVADRMFSDDEKAAVADKGAEEFFRLWARREAMVKAAGTTVVNYDLPSVLDSVVEFEEQKWRIESLELPEAECCRSAICWLSDNPDEEVEIEYIRIR